MKRGARKIRLLLADDHPVVREGIKSSLSTYTGIRVIGEAADGLEAVRQTKKHAPDVILLDINMPLMGGLEAARKIRSIAPKTRILALSMHDNREYVMEIVRLGASGYILKDSSPSELVRAIEAVYAGDAYFSPRISQHLLKAIASASSKGSSSFLRTLTLRERQVLRMIANGFTSKQIATRLGITFRTVESHRDRIQKKLDIRTTAGLTKYAVRAGIVEAE